MIYRFGAGFIVLFWLTMTGLLVRNEWWPDFTSLREVPVEHVVKLMLAHGETSDLNLMSEKLKFGHLRVHPFIRAEDNARIIDFTGYLQIRVPGLERQNVEWKGNWAFNKTLVTQAFNITLSVKKPTPATMELRAYPLENRAHYTVISGRAIQEDRDFSLDAAGLRSVLQELGIDTALFNSAQGSHSEKPVITARQSFIEVHGGKIDTYLINLSLEQSGQTLLEFHVDQLGRILRVNTLIGYTLAPDDLTP